MKTEIYKRAVRFHDAENILVTSELKITTHNGYPEFTMCNERANHHGQAEFVPKNGAQTDLYNTWKQYHLNGMSAGLPIQQKAITEWKKQGNEYDYNKVCDYLKSIDLYELPLKANLQEGFFIHGKDVITDTETYKYGNGWVHCVLPDYFENTLDEICDEIEKEEKNRFNDNISWEQLFDNDGLVISESMLETFELQNLSDHKIIALAKHLDISPKEANEDIEQSSYNDCIYSYSGTEYLVCTDEEADEKWDEELEYYIDECIICELPEKYKNYFDREALKSDAKYDGRGNSLGRYDGIEHEEIVNNTYYYIYKQ